MWVKKSESEKIEEERIEEINDEKTRLKRSLKSGFYLFIFTAVFEIIASLTIGISHGRHAPGLGDDALKFNELPDHIPGFLRLAAIFGFATFVVTFFSGIKCEVRPSCAINVINQKTMIRLLPVNAGEIS